MKHRFHLTNYLFIAAFSSLFAACTDAPKGDQATVTDQQQAAAATGQTLAVDTTASYVRFTGYGVGKNHPGKFRLSSGDVSVADNQVTGGQFVININSMDIEQKEEMFQNKLRPHLLSGDFFDAEKFSTAKFEITKVSPYTANSADTSVISGANYEVSGNLTLKDVTKNVTFPARIEMNGNALNADANFFIDRTQWQMSYGNDKSLGDKAISEKVDIQLALRAKG